MKLTHKLCRVPPVVLRAYKSEQHLPRARAAFERLKMKTTIEHTPTGKWKADPEGCAVITTDFGLRIEVGEKWNLLAQEAKDTILKCVNSHEALLEVCKAAEKWAMLTQTDRVPWLEQASNAIALAEKEL